MATSMTQDELLRLLKQSSVYDGTQHDKLDAIKTYISQPEVQAQILEDEVRLAEFDRQWPVGEEETYWSDDEYPGCASYDCCWDDLLVEAVRLGVDVVPLFFSAPWVDRIHNTLLHFLSRIVDAALTQPNRLELIELMLSSAAVRHNDPQRFVNLVYRETRYQFFDAEYEKDVQNLFIAHGVELQLTSDEATPTHEENADEDEEIVERNGLFDDSADY
ncbi:hypothetical protein PINS_up020958 [Pythium insidiosum]|nr:hypothetical protein PINS_up020958 [Pythium insidiosum]